MSYSPFAEPIKFHESITGGKSEPSEPATVSPQKSLTDLLDEIESRANAATPGPWVRHGMSVSLTDYTPDFEWLSNSLYEPGFPHDHDFIAAARSDVPALVKALREAHRLYLIEVGPRSWEHNNFDFAIAQLLREPAEEKKQDL